MGGWQIGRELKITELLAESGNGRVEVRLCLSSKVAHLPQSDIRYLYHYDSPFYPRH